MKVNDYVKWLEKQIEIYYDSDTNFSLGKYNAFNECLEKIKEMSDTNESK